MLLLGIAMVIVSDAWEFSQVWIILALVLFGLSFIVGVTYFGPAAKRIQAAVEAEGPESRTAARLISRSYLVSRIDLVVLLVIVWDMVAKPGL